MGFYGHFVAAGPDRSHSRIGVRPRGAPFIKESVYYGVSKKKMGIRNHEYFHGFFVRFLLDLHMRHCVHAVASVFLVRCTQYGVPTAVLCRCFLRRTCGCSDFSYFTVASTVAVGVLRTFSKKPYVRRKKFTSYSTVFLKSGRRSH